MMTIDKTIEAIEDLDTDPSNCILYEENSNGANYGMCDHYEMNITCADLTALAAELKELREFVGAIKTCRVEANDDEFEGFWQDDTFKFAYGTFKNHILASGTDPFDAWRKMNAGEGE